MDKMKFFTRREGKDTHVFETTAKWSFSRSREAATTWQPGQERPPEQNVTSGHRRRRKNA